jgi:hypothetical protein
MIRILILSFMKVLVIEDIPLSYFTGTSFFVYVAF